ncbi:hypothetical protein NQ314_017311 [Rhamnusium bicolor]|uniref:Glutathione transferase n=1 Tax=Rhamnusium bicolor TaxID=1586634 RepID=A0AAV8WUR2_9CUCU|nr:hypothetical protein NQ314_017311 [Rhamnusium bicolor]
MAPKLYIDFASPPCRAVLLAAKAINVELDLVELDLLKLEHLKPEFVKLNPLHTVPTLDDNGLVLCDSHAIMGYLIDKYSNDKSLYPEEVEKRALINQRLYFDAGILFARHLGAALSVLFEGAKEVTEKQVNDLNEAYGFIETFLQDNTYIAGNSLSIADFSILTTTTNSSVLIPIDEGKYPKISAWREKMRNLSFYDINQFGADKFRSMIEAKLKK